MKCKRRKQQHQRLSKEIIENGRRTANNQITAVASSPAVGIGVARLRRVDWACNILARDAPLILAKAR